MDRAQELHAIAEAVAAGRCRKITATEAAAHDDDQDRRMAEQGGRLRARIRGEAGAHRRRHLSALDR